MKRIAEKLKHNVA